MARPKPDEENLFDKIRSLSAEKLAEVEDFVDFLRRRCDSTVERRLLGRR